MRTKIKYNYRKRYELNRSVCSKEQTTETFILLQKRKKEKNPQPYEMPVGTRTQKSVKLLRECFRIMPSREAQAKQF